MKVWFFGGAGSRGAPRDRKARVGSRLDHFVTEIAQAVQDQVPTNYAVDANYQLISSQVASRSTNQIAPVRERSSGKRRDRA